MLNLLKIEWLKIKNYAAFKILAVFFVAGILLSNYIVYLINDKMISTSKVGEMLALSPYNFDMTWQTTSYVTGYLLLLPAMIIIMLLTNEYTFRTNRQNVIDGWSRHEFIIVKIVLAFIIALVSTILVFITAIGFGFTSDSTFSFDGVSHVGYFFLKAISYNMFAVLISVLVKKTGFAIGMFFIYLGTENFIAQLLDIFGMKLKLDNKIDVGNLGDYLPMNAADGLLTFPNNALKDITVGSMPTAYTYVVLAFAISYLCLFIWWSRHKYIKADL
jgi:ABC-2 type transport system permease protein